MYYNAYLPDLASRSHQGRVSAWSFAVGYAGSVAALLAALPFVGGKSTVAPFCARPVALVTPDPLLEPKPGRSNFPSRKILPSRSFQIRGAKARETPRND
ncbi:MAG TPA: hypothetical protein VIJ73_00645 [Methylomirabilota bacterium]